jgi:hypothetical protein
MKTSCSICLLEMNPDEEDFYHAIEYETGEITAIVCMRCAQCDHCTYRMSFCNKRGCLKILHLDILCSKYTPFYHVQNSTFDYCIEHKPNSLRGKENNIQN